MVAFVVVSAVVAAILIDSYWRFLRVPRLRSESERAWNEQERQRAELAKELETAQERFEWFAENTTDIMYQISVPEGQYTYINQAAVDYHKFSREEFTAQPMLIRQMLHPDYHEVFANEWAGIIAGQGCAPERDFRIYNKEGELRWLHHKVRIVKDENDKAVAVDGIVTDITEQKRAANALRDSEANLQRAQKVAGLGIWRYDRISQDLELSSQTYKVFGIEEGTRIGLERFWEYVCPEDREAVYSAWTQALVGKPFDIEVRIQTSPGDGIRWVYNRAEPEFDDSRACTAIVGVVQDITKRKRLEMELLHAQKMEAVGTLAGGIAHDFNNVLSVIMGYTEVLMKKCEGQPEYMAELRHTLDATERARNLVRQIKAYSYKAESQRTPVNLNRTIAQITEVWKRILPRAVRVEARLAGDLNLVSADANQVDQVLMNLATNAVDAMYGSGALTVRTENVSLRNHVCTQCGAAIDGDMVQITVSDTGCGIAPENTGKIFDSFYTTKEVGQGTGLGLSSALGIIERHGGHIECRSVVDSGTDFRIYLPAIVAQTIPVESPSADTREEPGGDETILLVDDEEDLLDINSSFLVSAGYRVLTANSGKDALLQYESHRGHIDLVVTDLNMPGMAATEYIQSLASLNPEAKVIAISGHFSVAEAARKLPSGVTCFIGKPYLRVDLLRTVRSVLDGRKGALV